jgi:hypothetical protein
MRLIDSIKSKDTAWTIILKMDGSGCKAPFIEILISLMLKILAFSRFGGSNM